MTGTAFDDANAQLAKFGVPLPTRSTISEAAAAAGVGVHAATSNHYVSITAENASQIAIFVHRNEVSVALDPKAAAHAAVTHSFCRLEPGDDSAPTRYVKLGHGSVRIYSSIVRDLFAAALQR
jgi:hypothetical protein